MEWILYSSPVSITAGLQIPVSPTEKQAAKTEQHQSWLAPDHVPQQPRCFVPVNLCQGFSCCNIQYVHQLAVLFLPEIMQGPPDQPMRGQLPPQRAQLASAVPENCVGDSPRAPKPGNDSADRGHFHLRRGVTHQVDFAISHAALDGHPLPVDWDSRPLPLERLESLLFEEPVEGPLGVPALFANHPQGRALGRFRNQPIKVWRVVGNEPDPRGVCGTILRQPYQGLHQRHSLYRRPAGRPGHTAHRSIGAHQAPGLQFDSPSGAVGLDAQSATVGRQAQEARVVLDSRSGRFGFRAKSPDQPRAFDDQVGPLQRDHRRTSVGKQFEPTNFVYDAGTAGPIYLSAKVVRDDQRAAYGVKIRPGFEYTHRLSAIRQVRCGAEAGCRPPNHNHFACVPHRAGLESPIHNLRLTSIRWSRTFSQVLPRNSTRSRTPTFFDLRETLEYSGYSRTHQTVPCSHFNGGQRAKNRNFSQRIFGFDARTALVQARPRRAPRRLLPT